MKHTLLIVLTIALSAHHSLLAMDPTSPRLRRDSNHAIAQEERRRMDAATQEDAERPAKLALLKQTPARFIKITCCNEAPADAFTDNDEVKTFKDALFATIDSVSSIQNAQGDEKSLTINIDGIAHHPFFAQLVDEGTHKLELLDKLVMQGSTNFTVIDGEKVVPYDDKQKQKILAALSTVKALGEDGRGIVFNLAPLRELPGCKKEAKQELKPPAQSVEPTLRQKLLNPTTAAVALSCLAVGYMLRGQGTNQ